MNEVPQLRNFDVDKDGHAASLEAAHAVTEFSPLIVPPMGDGEHGPYHVEPTDASLPADRPSESSPRTMNMGEKNVLEPSEKKENTPEVDESTSVPEAAEKEHADNDPDVSEGGALPPGGSGNPPIGGGENGDDSTDEPPRYTPERALSLGTSVAARLRIEQSRDMAVKEQASGSDQADPADEKRRQSHNQIHTSFEIEEDRGRAYIIQRDLLYPDQETDFNELVETNFDDDFINQSTYRLAAALGKPPSKRLRRELARPRYDARRAEKRAKIAERLEADMAKHEYLVREGEQLIPACIAMEDPEIGITAESILESDEGYDEAMRRTFTAEYFVEQRAHLLDRAAIEDDITNATNAFVIDAIVGGDKRHSDIIHSELVNQIMSERDALGVTSEQWRQFIDGVIQRKLIGEKLAIFIKARRIWGAAALNAMPRRVQVLLEP